MASFRLKTVVSRLGILEMHESLAVTSWTCQSDSRQIDVYFPPAPELLSGKLLFQQRAGMERTLICTCNLYKFDSSDVSISCFIYYKARKASFGSISFCRWSLD